MKQGHEIFYTREGYEYTMLVTDEEYEEILSLQDKINMTKVELSERLKMMERLCPKRVSKKRIV